VKLSQNKQTNKTQNSWVLGAHACNLLSAQEAEIKRIAVPNQPRQIVPKIGNYSR
jgi:hypothetical protein